MTGFFHTITHGVNGLVFFYAGASSVNFVWRSIDVLATKGLVYNVAVLLGIYVSAFVARYVCIAFFNVFFSLTGHGLPRCGGGCGCFVGGVLFVTLIVVLLLHVYVLCCTDVIMLLDYHCHNSPPQKHTHTQQHRLLRNHQCPARGPLSHHGTSRHPSKST